jgi:hypothetical protein
VVGSRVVVAVNDWHAPDTTLVDEPVPVGRHRGPDRYRAGVTVLKHVAAGLGTLLVVGGVGVAGGKIRPAVDPQPPAVTRLPPLGTVTPETTPELTPELVPPADTDAPTVAAREPSRTVVAPRVVPVVTPAPQPPMVTVQRVIQVPVPTVASAPEPVTIATTPQPTPTQQLRRRHWGRPPQLEQPAPTEDTGAPLIDLGGLVP